MRLGVHLGETYSAQEQVGKYACEILSEADFFMYFLNFMHRFAAHFYLFLFYFIFYLF
jgi:hypothetical protein